MEDKYVAYAIPFFFIAIFFELWINFRKGNSQYRFHDSITNLSCGIGQQVLGPVCNVIAVLIYTWAYEHFRLTTLPSNVLTWLALLFLVDFLFYWFHRASHRMNLLWAGHIVHHQSEEYNLSVALRQSWIEKPLEAIFYLPLALLGFSPLMYLAMATINTLYQFWIHTKSVRRIGRLEWVLNSPAYHRVHHAVNPKYIDKNYGGMFIIWDKVFGTFQEEDDEPVFGIVTPIASFNPLWVNVYYWIEMTKLAWKSKRIRDKLIVPWMPPDWRPTDLGGKVSVPDITPTRKFYDVECSRTRDVYVATQFVVIATLITFFLYAHATWHTEIKVIVMLFIMSALIVWGGLFERKKWAIPLECARWIALGSYFLFRIFL